MTRKSGWEESTKGPDWIDVMGLMTAIGTLHSGHVEVKQFVVGTGFATTVMVQAACFFDLLPGSQLPPVVKAESEYPCEEHATFVAHVFSLLYELDYEISKVYKNEELWK